MSDTQAAISEFRFLDEKRKTNGLTQPEETRWQELGAALGIDLSAPPQPAGYYGEDGVWYEYPPGYDPNAAWAQQQQQWAQQQAYYPPQQGYYDPNTGAYYPPQPPQQQYTPQYSQVPQGYYDPNTGVYYPPEGYAQQPAPQAYDPAQQQPYDPSQQQPYDPSQQQPYDPSQQQWGYPQQQQPQQQEWQQPAPAAAQDWQPPATVAPAPQPAPWEPPAADAPPPPAAPPKASAPVFVPFSFPSKPATPAAAPPPTQSLQLGGEDVMEISDEEVLEVPVTAPPAPSPVMPARPAPAPLPEFSLDSVDDLRGALLGDDDSEPSFPGPAALHVGTPMVATGPAGGLSSNSVASSPSTRDLIEKEPASSGGFMPSLDDLPEVEPEAPPAPVTGFLPSLGDLTVSEPAAGPEALLSTGSDFATPLRDSAEPLTAAVGETLTPLETKLEPLAAVVADDALPDLAIDLEDTETPAPAPVEALAAWEAAVVVAPEAQPTAGATVQSWGASVVLAAGVAPPADLPSVMVAPQPASAPSWDAPVEVAPEPVAAVPAPSWHAPVEVTPEPVAAGPAPVEVAPEPIAVGPAPVEVAPWPVAAVPAPVEVAPEPVAAVPPPSWKAPVELGAEPVAAPTDSWDAPVEVAHEPVEAAPVAPPWETPAELAPATIAAPPSWEASVVAAPEPSVVVAAPSPQPEPRVAVAPEPAVPAASVVPLPLPPSWDVPSQPEIAATSLIQSWDAPVQAAPSEPSVVVAPEPASWDAPIEDTSEAIAPSSWNAAAELAPEVPPRPNVMIAPEPPAAAAAWDAPIEEAPAPVVAAAQTWAEPAPLAVSEPEEPFLEATIEPMEAEVEAPAPLAAVPSSSAFDLLAMAPESAPRIPTFAQQPAPAPAPEVFASSWENEPAPPEARPDASVFGAAWDNQAPELSATVEPELAGQAPQAVQLASPADFLAPAPVAGAEEIGLEADIGEFVVESASAAVLATNVSEGGPSSFDDGQIELADNVDFLDHSQLTGTGASWSDDRNAIPLEGEAAAEDEGDVIQGMVLEEEEPAPAVEPADSWGMAVSQPSPAPQPVPVRAPLAAAPPPVSARVVPSLGGELPLQTRVAVPVAAPPPPTSMPVAGPGASAPALTPVGNNTQPVLVPGEHRVILHTVEGQVKRGAIKDARLGDPQLQLQLANGGSESLPRERVKALFFMLAPGARAPSTEGNKVRVTFKDGRQVAGFSKDHKGPTAGFFVVPADNRTNTERIFIFRHAVQSISVDG